MIQTNVSLPDHPDIQVLHIGPDQLPYVCVCEALERRVNATISWHWHQYFEVAYVAQGSLECRTPDQTLQLRQGEAVFVNTGVLHMYQKTSVGPCVIYAHIFDSRILLGTLSSSIYQTYIYPIAKSHSFGLQPIRPENRHQVLMLDALKAMVDLARQEPFGYEFQLQTQLSGFWCRLLTMANLQASVPDRSDSDIQRIKAMLHFIHGNYARHLTLKDIAGAAMISERECSRCFQRCFQESAIGYLNHHRIRVSAGMLLETQESILSISKQCGFSSPSYFGKLFHDMLGCTPKEYRRKATQNQATPNSQ